MSGAGEAGEVHHNGHNGDHNGHDGIEDGSEIGVLVHSADRLRLRRCEADAIGVLFCVEDA